MNKRQENDYDDFLEFTENEIKPLFEDVNFFLLKLKELINTK